MIKIAKPKTYTTVSGSVLFAIGISGFAFRGMVHLPLFYLFITLVLGFWGLAVMLNSKRY